VDHLGAEIGEDHRRHRARHAPREVEHANPLQRGSCCGIVAALAHRPFTPVRRRPWPTPGRRPSSGTPARHWRS
jgi:hypothetical protein